MIMDQHHIRDLSLDPLRHTCLWKSASTSGVMLTRQRAATGRRGFDFDIGEKDEENSMDFDADETKTTLYQGPRTK
jgi:hypothetical protein